MRDYNEVVKRTEALSRRGACVDMLDRINGYPVFCVSRCTDPSLPAIYVNGGTHGDEPAGMQGALAFLEALQERWLDRFQFDVIPCLNPYGYVHNTRLNAQEVDINWAFLRKDVPEIDVIKRFIQGRKFAAIMDLHEDWESPGYYLYEQVRGLTPAGPPIAQRVAGVCPLNTQSKIEGEIAENGVIFPDLQVEKRRLGGGVPIALFKQAYTDRLITSESPSALTMDVRVQAHLVALETMLEVHAGGLRVGKPDLKSARMKRAYHINAEDVVEPAMSVEDWMNFEKGVRLFNGREHWESHEAWEQVWRRHTEPSRIFFQGLIQLAAAYHQLQRGIYHGTVKHYNNSYFKLKQFPRRFLGVDVGVLKRKIEHGLAEVERLGPERMDEFPQDLVAEVIFVRPPRAEGRARGVCGLHAANR